MEVTLVIVTLVSLALAIAMGVITWRLLQEERLRADARVAALEQGLNETLDSDAGEAAGPLEGPVGSSATRTTVTMPPLPQESTPDETDWLAQFPPAGSPREEVDGSSVISGTGNLFGQVQTTDESSGLSRRAVAIAAVAAVMIGAVLAVWTIGRLMAPAADAPRTANAANAAPAPAPPAALELVSLRHVQQDGTLTITGLVRNPHAGVPQERLTAVVFFFDGQGGFLSSTRAPLDFRALAPGDESPFQIATPAPPGVARFRVSFRRDEGAIVPHVDRRQPQEASRS